MSRFAWSSLFALALIAASLALLPPGWAPPAIIVVVLAYSIALIVGVCNVKARFFLDAVCELPASSQRVLALTFDDGPDLSSTPVLLEVLSELDVRATFFCLGRNVQQHPQIVRDIAARGHVIGNHSFDHPWWMNLMMSRGLTRQILRCQDAVEAATGVKPRLYRSPMGLTNPHLKFCLARQRLIHVGWTIRSLDTWNRPAEWVADRVLRRLRPGAIILLHDGGRDAKRLSRIVHLIVDGARRQHYTFQQLQLGDTSCESKHQSC